jgi:tRNA-2-methylthio-N6-dimethylallyladenosine synthase
VTLLGQNVNSYGKRFPDGSGWVGPAKRRALLQLEARPDTAVAPPEAPDGPRLADFPALLRAIDGKTSIDRVRFTTSHPFDAHEELFQAMAECPAVCEFLHLPVQSGSDGVLRAMRRGYTVQRYLGQIARLRELVPGVALSTDIIVGFPGETEADFDATCDLMERVRYDSAFVFKYSPRPGTEAAGWRDDVPQPVKERRNQAVLALQERISRDKLEAKVGAEIEVLVEERNRRGQLTGKSRTNTTVVLEGPDALIGQLIGVHVHRVTGTTMIGELADRSASARRSAR